MADEHIVGVKTGTTDAAGACWWQPMLTERRYSLAWSWIVRTGMEKACPVAYAADRYALLDLAEAGQPLAYAADRLWRAAGDLLVLVEQEHMNQLMLRWSLPDETGRFLLQVVDASGAVLGTVEVI